MFLAKLTRSHPSLHNCFTIFITNNLTLRQQRIAPAANTHAISAEVKWPTLTIRNVAAACVGKVHDTLSTVRRVSKEWSTATASSKQERQQLHTANWLTTPTWLVQETQSHPAQVEMLLNCQRLARLWDDASL